MPQHAPAPPGSITLDRLPTHVRAVIRCVHAPTAQAQALQRRLQELGFVPGARVEVLRRLLLGRGPMAVRIGGTTFAMRPFESALIEVTPA
ncbi:MAG TPA: FeoA family protein [Aquabacterium sp.]|nr:FeoA family protein [Aquabacterium sp.]HRH27811.1 FeoA family protein [Aquabacterium sp.]